jgi:pyrroloquinoline quinone (PQQ) biosynthesis protein C
VELAGIAATIASPGSIPDPRQAGLQCAMLPGHVHDLLESALSCHRLLDHPFYRRWEAGSLAPGELAAYAGQYRHVEAVLPEVLARVAQDLAAGAARDLVLANLADECGPPEPHLALFDDFAAAVGASVPAEATPATLELVGCYRRAAAEGPVPALAALAAYEVQSSAIATTKGSGLRTHYGIGAAGTRFWDVHREADRSHAAWTAQALAELAGTDRSVAAPATAAAVAWWDFLSEREAAAAA